MKQTEYKLSLKEKTVAVILFLIVISQGMISPYFYLNWILGFCLIIYSVFSIFYNKKIQVNTLQIFSVSIMWTIMVVINLLGNVIIDLNEHFTYLFTYLFYMIVSTIIGVTINNLVPEKRNSFMLFINELWIVITLISYFVYIFLNDLYGSATFAGVMENRNNFAVASTIFISYLIFFKSTYKSKSRVQRLIFISAIMTLLSLSVKGFIGWILIYVLSIFINTNNKFSKRVRNRSIVIILVVLIIGFLVIVDHPIIYRIERLIMIFTSPDELRVSESAYLRGYFIIESINVIKEYFFTGIGLRNSKYYLIPPHLAEQGFNVGTYSHNNYLEIFLSGGIFAFLLYYLPIIYSIIKKKTSDISLYRKYLLLLGLYKLFVDFGAVTYDFIIVNIVHILMISGIFMSSKKVNRTI